MTKKIPPMHPGEVLREEFLLPMDMSACKLARIMDVPRTRVERISKEKTDITATSALLLGKALGTTPEFWMNLQTAYDLEMAKKELGKKVDKVECVTPMETAA